MVNNKTGREHHKICGFAVLDPSPGFTLWIAKWYNMGSGFSHCLEVVNDFTL